MKSHAPNTYICPICLGNNGVESTDSYLKQQDLVYTDDLATVWINSLWIKGNEGHVIIVPNEHYENLYTLPNTVGHRIFELTQLMGIAIKTAYKCDGITLRQNNEPAGDQHAFHYHMHVFPRYEGDEFNQELVKKSYLSDPGARIQYMKKLKAQLKECND